jgi:hypothetical protein
MKVLNMRIKYHHVYPLVTALLLTGGCGNKNTKATALQGAASLSCDSIVGGEWRIDKEGFVQPKKGPSADFEGGMAEGMILASKFVFFSNPTRWEIWVGDGSDSSKAELYDTGSFTVAGGPGCSLEIKSDTPEEKGGTKGTVPFTLVTADKVKITSAESPLEAITASRFPSNIKVAGSSTKPSGVAERAADNAALTPPADDANIMDGLGEKPATPPKKKTNK